MKRSEPFLMSLLFCCLTFLQSAFSQTVICVGNSVKIDQFDNDSTFQINNNFTRFNVVPAIEKSEYDIEIRLFTYGPVIVQGKAIIIRSNGATAFVTKKQAFFNRLMYGPTTTPVYRDNKVVAHEISSTKESMLDCSYIRKLKADDFFIMKSTLWNELSPTGGKIPGIDDAGFYLFEIKIGNKTRRFMYISRYGYDDPVRGRREKIDRILKVFEEISNIHSYESNN